MRGAGRKRSKGGMPLDARELYHQGFAGWLAQPFEHEPASAAKKPDSVFDAPDFEIDFCQRILALNPDHPEALALLGEAYARRGDYAKGLEADLRLSRIRPDSGIIQYNLACSYALNSAVEPALEALRRAVDLGYHDVEHMLKDRDLECLKTDPRFEVLLREAEKKQSLNAESL